MSYRFFALRAKIRYEILKNFLIPVIKELKQVPAEKRTEQRIEKFGKMGFWEETQS